MPDHAIIFDCDGVLVDSEVLGLEECATYLRGHGLSWTAADLVRVLTGVREDVFVTRLLAAYRAANESDPPADFFTGLIEAKRRNRDALEAVPGALAAADITGPKAVASSSRANFLESKLKKVGLWDAFAPHVYSAELVDHGKPAPDIFPYAAERLSSAPEACIVVEDSINGVEAGVAAGMTVVGFTGGGHCFDGHGDGLRDAGADWVASDFAALLRGLQRAA